jgi:hypothetical protein
MSTVALSIHPPIYSEREDPTMAEMPTPNLGEDLRRIHRAVTRGLTVAHENCQTYAAAGFPDAPTAEGFWKCCVALEGLAHAHHLSEDELFFPFLRERMPDVDFDALSAQHGEIHVVLEAMKAAHEAGSLADMNRALSKLVDLWHPHIAIEEQAMSPEASAEIVTIPETIELSQKAAALSEEHAQPAPLVMPYFLYNVDREDRAYYMAVLPEQLTQHLIPVAWKDEWAPMKPFLLD